jgi:glycosyltransferase involved in cell wall biosynthesis
MRIMHFTYSMSAARGGPPVVVARLAATQAAMGNEVSVVSCCAPPHGAGAALMHGLPGGAMVNLRDFDPSDPLYLSTSGADGKPPATLDIVHLHEFWIPRLWKVARAARRNQIPYVLSPHGTIGPRHLADKRLKKRIGMILGGNRLIAGARFVQAFTATEASEIAGIVGNVPVEVIPNGIVAEEFESLPPSEEFMQGVPGLLGKPYILFLARLSPTKGIDLLIESFIAVSGRHPSLQLVVAGPDYGAKQGLVARARAAGVGARVHVVGPLSGSVKLAAFRGAVATCLISRFEGFSMTLLESLACGTPVIASDMCNFPEIETNGVGLVVSCDAGAAARAIERMLSGSGERDCMAARARNYVKANFTMSEVAVRMMGAYRRGITQC